MAGSEKRMRAGGRKRRSRKHRMRTECHISVLLEWKRDQPELAKTEKTAADMSKQSEPEKQVISDRIAANQQPGTS